LKQRNLLKPSLTHGENEIFIQMKMKSTWESKGGLSKIPKLHYCFGKLLRSLDIFGQGLENLIQIYDIALHSQIKIVLKKNPFDKSKHKLLKISFQPFRCPFGRAND